MFHGCFSIDLHKKPTQYSGNKWSLEASKFALDPVFLVSINGAMIRILCKILGFFLLLLDKISHPILPNLLPSHTHSALVSRLSPSNYHPSFLFPVIARFLLVSAFLNFIHSSGYTSLSSLLTIWLKFLSRLPVFSVLLDLMDTLFSSSSIPGICNTVYSWIVSISLVAPSQSPFLATFAFCLLSKC